jgi:hypothetical protein
MGNFGKNYEDQNAIRNVNNKGCAYEVSDGRTFLGI